MKDKEARGLFCEYAKQTEIPERFINVGPRRWPTMRWVWIACASVALAATATVALWPKDSLAATLQRMDNAITNVDSMRATIYRTRLGKDRKVASYTYKGGKWRYDSFLGTALESTTIIGPHEMAYHQKSFSYATVGRPFAGEVMPASSALEYVMTTIDFGRAGIEREMHLQDGKPIDGRDTYVIVFTRSEDSYHAEIVVDSATDLPIKAVAEASFDEGQYDHLTWEFEWNIELGKDSHSAESFGVPVVDRDAGVANLQKEWARPITTASIAGAESRLRDIFIAEDGEVFLAYTFHPDESGTAPVPSKLTDDVGNVYARAAEYSPGGLYGEVPTRDEMALDGGEMRFSVFVPADTEVVANYIDVHWQMGRATWPASSDNDPKHTGAIKTTLHKAPARAESEFPPYSAAMIIDRYHIQKWIEFAGLRSETLLKQDQFDEAAEWGWNTYDRAQGFIGRIAYRHLDHVIDALTAIGKTEEAEVVRARQQSEKEYDEAYTRKS